MVCVRRECIDAFRPGRKSLGVIESKKRCALRRERIQTFRNVLPGLNPPVVCGREPVAVSHADGLRMELEDGSWLLLRPSRTEALVRVYAEAGEAAERDELLVAGCEIARGSGWDR